MSEKILTSYSYPDRPFALKAADAFLMPVRKLFNGKTFEYIPENKRFRPEDTKATALFTKILLGLLIVLTAPIILVACTIKHFVPESDSLQKAFDDDCTICYEVLKSEDTTLTRCGHLFHKVCIEKWILERPTCPVCNSDKI